MSTTNGPTDLDNDDDRKEKIIRLESTLNQQRNLLEKLQDRPEAAAVKHAISQNEAELQAIKEGSPLPERIPYAPPESEILDDRITEATVGYIISTLESAKEFIFADQTEDVFVSFVEKLKETELNQLKDYSNKLHELKKITIIREGKTCDLLYEFIVALEPLKKSDTSALSALLKFRDAKPLRDHLDKNKSFIRDLSQKYKSHLRRAQRKAGLNK